MGCVVSLGYETIHNMNKFRGRPVIMKTSVRQNFRKFGFNFLKLFIAVALIVVLLAVIFPVLSNALFCATYSTIGRRGRDIYKLIERANVEREAVGLPPLWPSDEIFTNSLNGQTESLNFTNSTDYFLHIYDFENAGTPQHSPLVPGFNFDLLAGAGVSSCTSNKLHWKNNMWTIAKNISKDTPGIMPVLVSRNLDAYSLAATYNKRDRDEWVSLAGEFDSPFSTKAAVIIRRNGKIHVVKYSRRAYRYIYKRKYFDTAVDAYGNPFKHPLKYLTPMSEVFPVGGGGKNKNN